MRDEGIKWVLLLPAVGWILTFTVYPLVFSLLLSFQNWNLTSPPIWVGAANYVRALQDPRMHNALRITALFVGATVLAELLLGFVLALLFHRPMRGIRLLRAVVVAPLFASPIALAFLGMMLFHEEDGPLAHLFRALGLPKVHWLSDPTTALGSVVLLDIWQWTPFAFLVFLAGLEGLPDEPVEAAIVDGAGRWALLRHVLLPLLAPVIVTALLFKFIYSVKVFDLAFGLTGGGPGISTEVLALYIHRQGLEFFNLGYASALSYLFLSLVSAGCIGLVLRVRQLYGHS
ncbi:MAG: sugar ABC transporter permease [Armatimonadota bacterium]|nr:sugar ABC transporter permease [Armatimonadota bacterium]MDR7438373.1 sugar ABC transporter permease [Armatimonadota bacterium]MDR7563361.1 sugar ABC transporter permease [Armatimonadota bacterium]MDR7568817.1 sugar ABC transporter permease [Armatimonadota bacterium]MDR7602417.1 sugar ABC transporter permease [Armatimonadota bacterium]